MPLPSAPHPPRVLHVSQPVEGGVARVVVDLAAAQAATGTDVHVACPPDG
ncbi:glycosyltransferase family 4 protein, partial [Streptomyces sp. SID10116]|nr:glycosyltransferase family 4 protein [Streptomyces sp. SID10116]